MFIRMRLKVTWLEKGGEGKIFGSATCIHTNINAPHKELHT